MLRAANEQNLSSVEVKNVIWDFAKSFKYNKETVENLFKLLHLDDDKDVAMEYFLSPLLKKGSN